MTYNVEVTFEGTTTEEITGLSKAEATKTAKAKATDNDYKVYVSFYRASDGQRGYLNRDGNHEITGKAW